MYQVLILVTVQLQDSTSPSAPLINQTLRFGPGTVAPIIDVSFPIMDDDVPFERPEILSIDLNSESHDNIRLGGMVEGFGVEWYQTITVTILDDDGEFSTSKKICMLLYETRAAP